MNVGSRQDYDHKTDKNSDVFEKSSFLPPYSTESACMCVHIYVGGGVFWEEYTEKLQNKDLLNFCY